MEKEIHLTLHTQRDVGNAINNITKQHVIIGIMDAKSLTILKRNKGR
jgi:hypothetical protein